MILPNFPASREYRKRQGSVKNEKAEYSFFPNSYGGNGPREGTYKPAAGILLSPTGSARKNPAAIGPLTRPTDSSTSSKTAETLSLCRNKLS